MHGLHLLLKLGLDAELTVLHPIRGQYCAAVNQSQHSITCSWLCRLSLLSSSSPSSPYFLSAVTSFCSVSCSSCTRNISLQVKIFYRKLKIFELLQRLLQLLHTQHLTVGQLQVSLPAKESGLCQHNLMIILCCLVPWHKMLKTEN